MADYKGILITLSRKLNVPEPIYCSRPIGPDHMPSWIADVSWNGLTKSVTATTRKEAERLASEKLHAEYQSRPNNNRTIVIHDHACDTGDSVSIYIGATYTQNRMPLTSEMLVANMLTPAMIVRQTDDAQKMITICAIIGSLATRRETEQIIIKLTNKSIGSMIAHTLSALYKVTIRADL